MRFPDTVVKAVLDYDFGPDFIASDMPGVITGQPPRIRKVLPTLVPRVNQDGNEIAGVAHCSMATGVVVARSCRDAQRP